jgi:hypothetical protein
VPIAIKPLISQPENPEKIILYPLTLYKLKVEINRLLKKPIVQHLIVQVDKIRVKGYLATNLPNTIEVEGEVMPSRLTDSGADKVARRTALYYILKKWRVGLPPTIIIEEKINLYKIFWVIKDNDHRIIVDSVTGDTEPI